MTDRELFEKALKALEETRGGYSQNLIAALHERLAQPEQEPVAWLVQYSNKHEFVWGQKPQWIADAIGIEPLYTTPQRREWVSLTDEEIEAVDKTIDKFVPLSEGKRLYARAIEAKLKEKNNG